MISLILPAFAGFGAGSYGRVQAATDLQGGHGEVLQIASFGPRLEQEPYLELDLWWDQAIEENVGAMVLVTPAVSGELFAYSGQWDASLALRNLYAELRLSKGVSVWGGERMLRGNDLYLLDMWPLDELNLVGVGTQLYKSRARLELALGANRLADPYQLQQREVAVEGSVETESILSLDRQRFMGMLKASWFSDEVPGFFLSGYSEIHLLPSGVRYTEEQIQEQLPADKGGVIGAELNFVSENRQIRLWYGSRLGLAAWDELAVPKNGFNTDYTTQGSARHTLAFSLSQRTDSVSILAGGYGLRFVDADGVADREDRWEWVGVVRPSVSVGRFGYVGIELSDQWVHWDGLNPGVQSQAPGNIFKAALIPAFQLHPGPLERPQIRLQYVVSVANEAARSHYADTRSEKAVSHFIGAGAEWWISSRSYR
jgi:maltoporin